MRRANYIAQGYSCPAYVRGQAMLFEDFRFTYKPMLSDERAAMIGACSNKKSEQAELLYMETVVRKITQWDLRTVAGEVLPLTLESIRRMSYPLWLRVYAIIAGHEACDYDPEWDDEDRREHFDPQIGEGPLGKNS